jgi:hypothetical protein
MSESKREFGTDNYGNLRLKIGDEVQNYDVRFFVGEINDNGANALVFIDKNKPFTLINTDHPMARCIEQGNFGLNPCNVWKC